MEPIINSQLPEFKVQAFQNGSFKTVTNEDVKGKWAIFFFYPADFTFVCPTELVDMAEKYEQFQAMAWRCIPSARIRISCTRLGMMLLRAFVQSSTRCWQTRRGLCAVRSE